MATIQSSGRACSTCATAGDNSIVSAPGAGKRIGVHRLKYQNEVATSNTVIVKFSTTAVDRTHMPNNGDGYVFQAVDWREYRDFIFGGDNQALLLNLSAATTVGYTVDYVIADV